MSAASCGEFGLQEDSSFSPCHWEDPWQPGGSTWTCANNCPVPSIVESMSTREGRLSLGRGSGFGRCSQISSFLGTICRSSASLPSSSAHSLSCSHLPHSPWVGLPGVAGICCYTELVACCFHQRHTHLLWYAAFCDTKKAHYTDGTLIILQHPPPPNN